MLFKDNIFIIKFFLTDYSERERERERERESSIV